MIASRKVVLQYLRIFYIIFLLIASALADSNTTTDESPWLVTPLISSEPKLGSSIGAMGGYLHKFDKASPSSMFMLIGTYSTTDSYIAGLFGRTYFDEDRQRLVAGLVKGKINNEYNDFLGSGLPVNTTDDLYAAFTRYTYRIYDDWFFGAQAVSTNYSISGNDWLSDKVLNFIGLDGFKSNALGLVIDRDTRDNQNSPSKGASLVANNLAYRKAFGGNEDFDVYELKYRTYIEHYKEYVLAMRVEGRWTVDAPSGAYSSVNLRGYTQGQYLAPHATTFEAEERIRLSKRWGATVAGGAACLYGGDKSCSDQENWFPAVSAGINYMLKVEEKMVIRADVAAGKSGNYGFYLQFGRPF